MEANERILQFIGYKNISVNAFEKSIGKSTNYVRNSKSFTSNVLASIMETYPELSIEWLITGNGEMLKASNSEDNQEMRILHRPKSIEKVVDEQFVTLYDVDAAANLKTLFDNKDQHVLGKIKIPNMPKCDGAVYVKGDSMYPLLKSGDIIIYKEIKDFQNVIFGEMYLVSMDIEGDEYLAVKYVNKSDYDGCIKLVSYNTYHQPKDVNKRDIRAMALVKVSIRMNTMR